MAADGEQLPAAQPAASSQSSVLRSVVRAGLKREFAFAIRSQAELSPSLGRLRARSTKTSPPSFSSPTPTAAAAAPTLSSKKFKNPGGYERPNGIGAPPGFPLAPTHNMRAFCAEGSVLGSHIDDAGEWMGVSADTPVTLDGPYGPTEDGSSATSKRKLELKMSKMIAPVTKVPSDVGELLATGLLNGLQVTCSATEDKQVGLLGVIRDDSILCFCPSCEGSNAVSASQFEEHADCLRKSPSDCIYLENGKSLHDVLKSCTASSVDMLEVTIQNAIGLVPMKKPLAVRECEGREPQETQNSHHGTYSCDRFFKPVVVPDTFDIASKSGSSHKKAGYAKITRKDLRLHKLVFASDTPLLQGTEVAYYVKGKKLLEGYIKDSGIHCHCCNNVISPSQFEAHAGQARRRKPYNYIYMSNGVSLHELSVSLSKERKISTNENDDLCSYCEDVGILICCDLCPRAFHAKCLGLSVVPDDPWYCKFCTSMHEREKFVEGNANAFAAGRNPKADAIGQILQQCIRIVNLHDTDVGGCVLCRSQEFSTSGFNSRTVIICDQCDKEFHVGCLKDHNIVDLKELPAGKWFCSMDCSMIHHTLQELLSHGAKQIHAADSDLMKNKLEQKGLSTVHNLDVAWRLLNGKTAAHKLLIDEAESVFYESFDPILDTKNKDLIPVMLNGESTIDHDFTGVYCAVLTVGSSVVSAGLLRILGCEVAELPLVATSRERQGQGYCQLLFSCIERLLSNLRIKHFVLPAAPEVEEFWTTKFGFVKITSDQLNKYTKGVHTMIFRGTSVLHKPIPRWFL